MKGGDRFFNSNKPLFCFDWWPFFTFPHPRNFAIHLGCFEIQPPKPSPHPNLLRKPFFHPAYLLNVKQSLIKPFIRTSKLMLCFYWNGKFLRPFNLLHINEHYFSLQLQVYFCLHLNIVTASNFKILELRSKSSGKMVVM